MKRFFFIIASLFFLCPTCLAQNAVLPPARVVNGILGIPYNGAQVQIGTLKPGGGFTILPADMPQIGGAISCLAGNPLACVFTPVAPFQVLCNSFATTGSPTSCVKTTVVATDVAGVDPTGATDSTAGLRAAIALAAANGKRLEIPQGTYCLSTTSSTLAINAPNLEIFGDGEFATTLKYCAPTGSQVVPIMNLQAAATGVKVHDLGFDNNVAGGGYVEGSYYSGNALPIGEAAVINQADESNLYNLTLRNSFDNCLVNIRVTPPSTLVAGSPQRGIEHNIHTYSCGIGNHLSAASGGPGKIGAGIDNADGSGFNITDVTDNGSYGSFIDDAGGINPANWSNVVSWNSQYDPNGVSGHPIVPAFFMQGVQNNFSNILIVSPSNVGVWANYGVGGLGTTGNNVSNLIVKGSASHCLYIKGNVNVHGLVCQDTATNYDNILVDGTYSPFNFQVTDALFTGSTANSSVHGIGSQAVVGRVSAMAFPGVNASTVIPATMAVDIESQTANGRGFGNPNPTFNYDFIGSFRATAKGAAPAYTTTIFGDQGDATSMRAEASTGQRMAWGWDPVNGFFVQQCILPGKTTLSCMINPTSGNVGLGRIAPTVTDTTGYPMIGSTAGAPTGTPAAVPSGMNAMRYDSTNHKLWVYDGGWKGVAVN